MKNEKKTESTIGKKLDYWRVARKLTTYQLADAMGVSRSQVADWLQGRRIPKDANIENACNVLNIHPTIITGGLPEEIIPDAVLDIVTAHDLSIMTKTVETADEYLSYRNKDKMYESVIRERGLRMYRVIKEMIDGGEKQLSSDEAQAWINNLKAEIYDIENYKEKKKENGTDLD